MDQRQTASLYTLLPSCFPHIFPQSRDGFSVHRLAGDASERRYYRVLFAGNSSSLVVMQLPEPFTDPETLPFCNVHAHLAALHLPVPRIVALHPPSGLLLLEDLGDVTLEKRLQEADAQTQERLYRQAIDLLLTLQIEGSRPRERPCVAFHLAFDEEKLMWELDFFLHHAVEQLWQQTISPRDRQRFRQAFLELITPLVAEKRYFTHRDYHSRNLMVRDDRLAIIDFQDARMGLCQYDLASLLRDSYYSLPPPLFQSLLHYYMEQKALREGKGIAPEHFRYIFDRMAIQRNLKAIGTFAFQAVEKGRAAYLRYIPRTVQYVQENIARHPELSLLGQLLTDYVFAACERFFSRHDQELIDEHTVVEGE
ncbi:MAG: hypothetical protein D6736_03530 [Nitrospinota bacterium]|nr:MAG: hypothetical protein D6736_03530 [Nitrospinota bacterium]